MKCEGKDDVEPLFEFQKVGAQWLTERKYALLADEMRLGKTAQTIAASDQLGLKYILVLCPAIARINWTREFVKFSTSIRDSLVLLKGVHSKDIPQHNLVVCSYDLLLDKSVNSALLSRKWELLVLDEVHHLKEPKAKRSKKVFGIGGLVHQADRTWALSGTPTPNNNSELWIMLFVFGITKLSYDEFIKRYCTSVEIPIRTRNGRPLWRMAITGARNIDELRTLLAPHVLRRKREEVLKDLPPINISHVAVEAGPVDIARWWPQVMLGHDTEADIMEIVERERAAIDALINIGGRKEVTTDGIANLAESLKTYRRYVGLQKVESVAGIIEDELRAKVYNKIVIFAWHKDVMEDLRVRLHEFHPLKLFGGTPAEDRDEMIRRFQKIPKYRVFIGQIKACGTAIELSAAHEVAFIECSWVPSDNAQAAMRVHNIIQKEPVNVRFFGLADTSDEKVQQVLRRKTRDIVALFDEKNPLTKEQLFS
jgi:SNF2 family DNA or RNA helicase